MEQTKRTWRGLFGRIAASVAAVGLLTFVLLRIVSANSTTASLAFMLLVLVISAVWSLWEALATAVTAALVLAYYFLPPMGFQIADPNDMVALGAFVVCALIASQLALTARRRTAEASRRQDEMERLYAISRAFLLVPDDASVASMVAFQLAQVFGFPAVAIFLQADGQVYRSGPEDVPLTDEQLRNAAHTGAIARNVLVPSGAILSLAHDGVFVGTLALRDKGIEATTLHAIANLTAVVLFRARQRHTVSQ